MTKPWHWIANAVAAILGWLAMFVIIGIVWIAACVFHGARRANEIVWGEK